MKTSFSFKPKYKDVAIILFFSKGSILSFSGFFPISSSLIVLGLIFLIYGFLGISLVKDRRTIKYDSLFVLAFVAIFFYLTNCFHPEYHDVMFINPSWNIYKKIFNLVSAPFAYLLIRSQINLEQLKTDFKYVAHITFACNCLGFLHKAPAGATDEYNMGYGYLIAIPAVLYLWLFLNERDKKRYLILSVIAIAEGVLFGSRGCILGYVAFFVLYMLIVERGITKMRIAFLAAVGAAAYAFTSNTVFENIYQTVRRFGIDSRTLKKLASNDIMDDNARNDIYDALISKIEDHSIFYGYGAYGDRYILKGYYSHNILLELAIDFGLVFSIVIVLVFCINMFRIVISYKDDKKNLSLLLVFFCYSIGRLMFSSSFWYEPMFGGLIGLMVIMLSKQVRLKNSSTKGSINKLIQYLTTSKGG